MKEHVKLLCSIPLILLMLLLASCYDESTHLDSSHTTKQVMGSEEAQNLVLMPVKPYYFKPILKPDTTARILDAINKKFTANVMAPLHVDDWDSFESELDKAKNMGVMAVSVDVWWGDVEKKDDDEFDWSYYERMFEEITERNMKILPIMSFHECKSSGGNVNDDYDSSLPTWIWDKYNGTYYRGYYINSSDMKYKSEYGNESSEAVSLWMDPFICEEYIEFMDEFEEHFAMYADSIQEINVSCGSAGELRYPSYNYHDGWDYPGRGAFQCYSRLALKDFRDYIKDKYTTIYNVNKAWDRLYNDPLNSFDEISPPTDHDDFFRSGAYKNIQYGKDFTAWYNERLLRHGRNMMSYADTALDEEFASVRLGFKIPGLHWRMCDPEMERAAEICAGIITSDFSSSNGNGYKNVVDMIDTAKKELSREIVLHFTCLEMDNNSNWPNYSLAKDLVFHVANAAKEKNLTIKGENALPGGNDQKYFWDNIDNAITWGTYHGITILRIHDVVNGNSYNYYKDLISTHKD